MNKEELLKIARKLAKIRSVEGRRAETALEAEALSVSIRPKYAEQLMIVDGLEELMEAVWLAGTVRDLRTSCAIRKARARKEARKAESKALSQT